MRKTKNQTTLNPGRKVLREHCLIAKRTRMLWDWVLAQRIEPLKIHLMALAARTNDARPCRSQTAMVFMKEMFAVNKLILAK